MPVLRTVSKPPLKIRPHYSRSPKILLDFLNTSYQFSKSKTFQQEKEMWPVDCVKLSSCFSLWADSASFSERFIILCVNTISARSHIFFSRLNLCQTYLKKYLMLQNYLTEPVNTSQLLSIRVAKMLADIRNCVDKKPQPTCFYSKYFSIAGTMPLPLKHLNYLSLSPNYARSVTES